MTLFGKEKASIIASVAAALKQEKLAPMDESLKDIVVTAVGLLLEQGYDLADIRYAACEIGLTPEEKLWTLIARVREEFTPRLRAGLPAAPTGEGTLANLYNQTQRSGGVADA